MVRLKHRYLLINILYPEAATTSTTKTSSKAAPLPPTIQFHAPSSDLLTSRLLLKLLRDTLSTLFGDHGSGLTASSLVIKYLSAATSTAIVRVSRAHYRLVWAALTFVDWLPRPIERRVVLRVVAVSGTMRKCGEEAVRRARASARRAVGGRDELVGGGGEAAVDVRIGMLGGIEHGDEDGDEDGESDGGG